MVGCNKLVTLLDLCVSSLRRGHANLLCIVLLKRVIPEGNPHATTGGKDGPSQKFKEALTTRFWQPSPCKHLLPCIVWFDILPLRLGVAGGGGTSPCENPHPRAL